MSFLGALLEGIFEQVFIEILAPLVISVARFPGALLGWLLWRGRSFNMVWMNGDRFGQGMAGIFIYALIIAVVLLLSEG